MIASVYKNISYDVKSCLLRWPVVVIFSEMLLSRDGEIHATWILDKTSDGRKVDIDYVLHVKTGTCKDIVYKE